MNTLFEILPQAEGAQCIRDCWGDVPQFFHIEILHLRHTNSVSGASVSIVAVLCIFENNQLSKPSKMVIEFCDVSHLEYLDVFGEDPVHGITLDRVFTSRPPNGVLAIETKDQFYVACRRVRVLSCVYEPFTETSV